MSEGAAHQDYRSLLQDALLKIRDLKSRIGRMERSSSEPIAIIGVGCRFPRGIRGPEDYWQLLQTGEQAISEVPLDRWSLDKYYDPDPDAPGKMSSRHGGFLDDVDCFDAAFFGISPAEATSMDPQHRLLLEVGWEALENAGQSPDHMYDGQTGVFIGVSGNDYSHLLSMRNETDIDSYLGAGISHGMAAGRISHRLGLHGPSLSIDTACSSSLVAVHLACQSLRTGDCDLALTGGVNLILRPELSIYFSKAGLLSADGRCKTFAAAADGVVRGEGCGVVVLKRLANAEADRDNISAVIRGSSVNHDGPSGGLTVPNGPAQQALIRDALAAGGVAPLDVSVVEAHGAGTLLGDSIEIGALAAVYGDGRPSDTPLIVASHKTNLGHLESAGGIAGLIKVVLALQHREIPPHLNFDRPNPNVPWDHLPIRIPTQRTPWTANGRPRVAGVSSFSFSGTNAHIVVEEAPVSRTEQVPSDRSPHVLTLSARCESALRELAQRYFEQLGSMGNFADICFTANMGRSHHDHRLAVVAGSSAEAAEELAKYVSGQDSPGLFHGIAVESDYDQQDSIEEFGPTSGISALASASDAANLERLAKQFVQGGLVDWEALEPDSEHRKVPLPTYPFQRQRFWVQWKDGDHNKVLV